MTCDSDGAAEFAFGAGAGRRPHQRDRLREVADIVPRQLEQHRIGALGDQRADHVRLGVLERQRIGERGQRPAALRVARAGEIVGHQPQLVVAAGLVGEAVEQFGEAVHASRRLAVGRRSGSGAVGLVLVAIADDVERPRLQAVRHAPMHQRVLLPVRHPHLAGAGRRDGCGEPVPVGMVGDDQRQLDAALARPRPHPHPARRERGDRIGEAARPQLLERRGRAERDGAGQLGLAGAAHAAQLAERDAAALVVVRDALERAVQIDRLVVAGLADERDDALRLAERIGADEMRPLGKQRDRMQQLGDLAVGIAVAEHRQSERRLGDEHVASDQLERRAGRIGARSCSRRRRRCAGRRPRRRSAPSRAHDRPGGRSRARRRAAPSRRSRSPASRRRNPRRSAAA